MTSVSRNAKIVRVHVERGREGLSYATSPDLKGLLVAEPAYEALTKSIPDVIMALYAACEVEVRQADRRADEALIPWVAIPVSVARRELAKDR